MYALATDEVRIERTELVVLGWESSGCGCGCHKGIVPHPSAAAGLGDGTPTDYIGRPPGCRYSNCHPFTPERLPLMPAETLEFLLLLSGWIVAFLLGRELQTGFRQWRLRTAEQRARRQD